MQHSKRRIRRRQPCQITMPFVLQIVGYKNSGKTTLISRLLELILKQGIQAAIIKHDAHGFEMDHPGTDTYKLRTAGAHAVAITSSSGTAVLEEGEQSLEELISRFAAYDVVLVEGFKEASYPKWVMIRQSGDIELLYRLRNVRAAVWWDSKVFHHHSEHQHGHQPSALSFRLDDMSAMEKWLLCQLHGRQRE
ncbi:molybdopterin-guanine dinucleotide biosynthesis protein B [Paenibacillus sp. JX-17]|uniref:Molybdopterin-guanine dinucleotide biosynthesis protein B n=1 Tax=Paenibacillus lacisoli TaxID=3064525 RepID=A0ABT9CB81_9BACL|nr:molybdopterin-guanine dinucleotide biosynthesis protein B [Paenibacillus sp. JX-17]MDO7904873.1 molybdopterin-guanine dinucleotide biosynthesis protein B [Paenibacillus sp. JX-17]